MLTKKQKKKVIAMVSNYEAGILKTSKAPKHIIKAWVQRYRISLELRILKQCKR